MARCSFFDSTDPLKDGVNSRKVKGQMPVHDYLFRCTDLRY